MYLFKSWGESVSMFKPSNLKLLFLVTLNTLRNNYKLFAGTLVLFALLDTHIYFFGANIFITFIVVSLFLYMPFAFVLTLRPSIKTKNLEYFLDYKWHLAYWLIIPIITILFMYFGVVVIKDLAYTSFDVLTMGSFFFIAVPIFVLPIKIMETFFALFWLDSRPCFKNLFLSWCRAIKMFVLNLPAYLILFVAPYLIFMLFVDFYLYLVGGFWPIITTYLVLLVSIFYTCFLVNFYTKNIHDKFKIYFGE